MHKKVIVAGHICLDITPSFKGRPAHKVSEILQPGQLLQVGNADVHTGGVVANTGLAMKLLGADVTLMGKLGTDAWADIILNQLSVYDAANGMIQSADVDTSYSIVLAMPGIDRIFLHNPGANDAFTAEDIPAEALQNTDLLHFGYPPLMRSMYENDGTELTRLFQKVKSYNCMTSLDMAAIDSASDAGKANWDLILRNTLPYTDFFLPSAEELCCMLDSERYAEWRHRAGDDDCTELLSPMEDIKPLADRCIEYGAKVVIVKCGAAGMYYKTASCEGLFVDKSAWSYQEGFEPSYIPEQVVSGTGAGDTSIAAFLTAMLNGEPLADCLHLAAAEGASCVAAIDALSGLKTLDALQQKIAAGWPKRW